MPADLLMIVPTRGRPGNAERLARAFDETRVGYADLLFAVDGDHDNARAYRDVLGDRCVFGPWRGMVATLNHYERWDGRPHDYFAVGFMGDDHLPRTPAWDKALVDALHQLGTGVAYGNDLLQGERLPTAVALTADIPHALGYMAPPALRHLFVDDFWRELGRALGRITYLPDVVIEHLHPAAGKAEADAGYDRVNSSAATQADAAAWDMYLNTQFQHDVDAVKALL